MRFDISEDVIDAEKFPITPLNKCNFHDVNVTEMSQTNKAGRVNFYLHLRPRPCVHFLEALRPVSQTLASLAASTLVIKSYNIMTAVPRARCTLTRTPARCVSATTVNVFCYRKRSILFQFRSAMSGISKY